MKVTVVIPARYASSRLPGKPLAKIGTKPMVQHVYERASQATLVDEVLVATDDRRIQDAVQTFQGKVVMTSSAHKSGTDRVAEVSKNISSDVFINVQGDEPLISPKLIDQVASVLINEKNIQMASAKVAFKSVEYFLNPNVVKVICDDKEFALFFSRYPIPFRRQKWNETKDWNKLFQSYSVDLLKDLGVYKHLGIYGFRRELLNLWQEWPQTSVEVEEELEQFRALRHGTRIKVLTTLYESVAVDTPQDLEKVNELLNPKNS